MVKDIIGQNAFDIPQEDPICTGNPAEDVSRLEMRVGYVLTTYENPYSRNYYQMEVHVAEERERICIARLAPFFDRYAMRDKLVVVVTNVRHKVKGIISNCFVLYAKSGNKVELLEPPPRSTLGDTIYVPTYLFDPFEDLPYIWPNKESKRIFDLVAPDLKVNSLGQAEYKGMALRGIRKGFVTVPTLRDCPIFK